MPNMINHPHDNLFTHLMSNEKNVSDFIRQFLPKQISESINYDTLKIIDSKQLNLKYKKYTLDILTEAEVKGCRTGIYFVFEHKSYKDKHTLLQILSYCLAIWESNLKNNEPLRPIIPVVFYHGKSKYGLPVNFGDYFEVPEELKDYMVNFRYELFDTSMFSNDEFMKLCADNLFLKSALIAFKNIFSGREGLSLIFRTVSGLENDIRDIIIVYAMSITDISEEEIIDIAKEGGILDMPSLAKRLYNEGMEYGRQEGWQRGSHEGWQRGRLGKSQELLIRLVHLKFRITESEKEFIRSVTDMDKLDKAAEATLFEKDKGKLLDILKN